MPHRDRVSRCVLSLILFMFALALVANMIPVTNLDRIAQQSTSVVSDTERREMLLAGTPHSPIAIDGDGNFSDTALLEGWPGHGFPESPYIIDGLDIDLGGEFGSCISISNTRVSFIISNCNLTGASGEGFGVGIGLENVMNGELVENIVDSNGQGIYLVDSDYNTMVNNLCNNNIRNGIHLQESHSNTVANNICSNNTDFGIWLDESHSNAVEDNTCNSNGGEYSWHASGISLTGSHHNIVANNICSNNTHFGISFHESSSNTITDNILNSCGFLFTGTLTECRQLKITGNSVNTLPLVFLQDQVGNVVSFPAGQVILVGCSQVTVKDQTLMDCSVGILLCHSNLTALVNNTCNSNGGYNGEYGWWIRESGIRLDDSHSNTAVNNTCNNIYGISVVGSHSNTVVNNTCDSSVHGIDIWESFSSIVTNNTCNYNRIGIHLENSYSNTVVDNTCNSNDIGIRLDDSHSNSAVNNTCNNNRIGIYLFHSHNNTVANNTFLGNTEHDIVEEEELETTTLYEDLEPEEFNPVVLLLIGLVGITLLGAGWREAYRAYVSEEKKRREVYQEGRLAEERQKRSYKDDISIPVRYRLVSWLRMRRPIRDVDTDESLEHDSSDQ